MLGEELSVTQQKINKENWLKMIQAGANHLTKHRDTINKLNVFPVPDGDTGTNMNLSMTSGVKEMKQHINKSLSDQINGFTRGLLMGARGNSGVILSQLFRGFSAIELDKDELAIKDFTNALNKGVEIAYNSVTNPVEGTILTVAKDMAKKATEREQSETDMLAFLEAVVAEGKASLERTPDLLPVLKEVGVVDSGGKGLIVIYEGFLAAFRGEEIEMVTEESFEALIENEHDEAVQSFVSLDSIEHGYCTEFFVQLNKTASEKKPFNEAVFRRIISDYGDSLLVASDSELVKVHVHTEKPGEVLSLAQEYGDLINIDIENMREQYKQIVAEKEASTVTATGNYTVITVAQGSGLKEMFQSIGATNLIDGGQTMNPSTEDFLRLIERQTTEHIFILPNNKNILLSANQAVELTDKAVTVIPTVTIPQGIQAMFEFAQEADVEENIDNMSAAIAEVKTGLVTYATRDTVINDVLIKKDDFIGLNDDTIVVSEATQVQAVQQLLEKMIDQDEDEIVTVFAGVDASADQVAQLEEFIEREFPDIEAEFHQGNQPIYSYMLMIE